MPMSLSWKALKRSVADIPAGEDSSRADDAVTTAAAVAAVAAGGVVGCDATSFGSGSGSGQSQE